MVWLNGIGCSISVLVSCCSLARLKVAEGCP